MNPPKNLNLYTVRGFKNRSHYLENLSEEMGIELEKVLALASLLGPCEDFDGLVTTLEDQNW